jgi:hypothetical protein
MLTALVAISTIALMGLFARKNRKEGWIKPRKEMIENLRAVDWNPQPDLSAVPEVAGTSWVSSARMAINPDKFSQQLGTLITSLHRANASVVSPVYTATAKATDRNRVTPRT